MVTASKTKVDIILHPVRLRILQRLLTGAMTAQELAQSMPDVPHASLYRHIRRLTEAGILSVVAEKPVRGATERTYAVSLEQTSMSPDELRGLTPDDHMRLFMAFIASVINGFQRYVEHGPVDLVADGVSYSQVTLYLDDEELRQLKAESAAMTMKALANKPRPGRRARILSSVVVLDPSEHLDRTQRGHKEGSR